MVKAIIFDCFGVLASDGWLPFKNKYFSQDQTLFDQASDLNKQVDSGLADYDEFISQVAELAHVPDAEARHAIEDNPPHEQLFNYIATELKPKYKIGMLSNAGANWLAELFTTDQIAMFDAVALSYETGFIKPGERAYKVIAERLGVRPDECVFIDDQERFCFAARDVGMQSIHYQDFEQLQRDLSRVLEG